MNYIIAICLIYMLAILTAVVVQLAISSRKDRLKQIKNFKRGKFALIYFALIPLYFLAFRHNGLAVDGALWQAFNASVEAVVLKYHYSDVASLMNANLFYKITVELGFALITLNAVMFSVSFCGQFVMNLVSSFVTRKFKKKVVVVVGYNQNSIDILKSIKKQHGKAVLMGKLTPELRDNAFLYRANYINLSPEDDFGGKILKLFKKFDRKKVSVILNCEDDAVSLRYVKQLCKMIEKERLTALPLTKPYGLQAYVFASKANESTFAHYEEASYGLVKFMSRHEQIATDFIKKYPLTQFMTERQLDYETATVKNDVNLNVVMVGFGKLNETLFLTSVSNNQFLTIKDGKLSPKAVNYHIYDRNYPAGKISKEHSVHSRSLNHGYMRYEKFLKENAARQGDYLEFLEEPAKIQFHPCDISHSDFYASVRNTLSDKNAYSYVILSFGTDMENIELAEKLQQKIREWNTPSFVKIFVKMRDEKLAREIKEDFEGDLIQVFGTNQNCVYNADGILNEKTEYMAKLRHLLYIAEDEQKKRGKSAVSLTEEALENRAREKWYRFKQFQRESNVYGVLSLRMKLHLLGYDMAEKGDDMAEEFEDKYERGDKRTPSEISVEGKTVWNYCNAEQGRQSIRWTYAVQEHQRWCANMICNGIIPSDKEEIKLSGGRVFEKRLHGNLTTMDGLVEYRELTANATGVSEEDADVIRYDYQLMDDAVWLLHRCGYKLTKKK